MHKPKKGIALWNEAKKIIPGGTQLLSKRSELFLPEGWPSYYKKAKGVDIWDLDGNHYIDMATMSVGACILGYADPDVNRAVKIVIDAGSTTTLNSKEEVELAKLLIRIHPWAGMVRYARSGGEAMAIAVRIARAHTKKDALAFCGYHGWHDWYLAANLADSRNLDGHLLSGLNPLGVPRVLKGTALPFHYNNIEELRSIVKNHDIGTIIIEPIRHENPKNDFLSKVREIADSINAVLIVDEVSAGWRMTKGGAHMMFSLTPDIAVFSKAISNGYPMAAVIGKKGVMEAAQDTFISSTSWTERIGPAAALATIKKLLSKNVVRHIERVGKSIGKGWEALLAKHELKGHVIGPPCFITFSLEYEEKSNALHTLFTQEMLKRGFLAGRTVYVSYAHNDTHVTQYLRAVDQVFAILKKNINDDTITSSLEGPVAHTGFTRLTQ